MIDIILKSNNIERDSYVWNMVGSFLNAFQSVILLIILTRIVDLNTAGVFTIANANANLFLNIGKYGVRNYQVSDVRYIYSFEEYRKNRTHTVMLMLLVAFIYIIIAAQLNEYKMKKTMILIWMCVFKAPDAYEDVYWGEYQRRGRLDVASKCMSIRIAFSIFIFGTTLLILHDLLLSLMITSIFTIFLMFSLVSLTKRLIEENNKKRESDKKIFERCFPLFMASFLSFYIGNAPKYAIDAQLTDKLQAIYGFISMPVFIVGLLNGFVFNPILYSLSCKWNEKRIDDFIYSVIKQIFIVIIITSVCVAGAYIIGIPILSIVYNTDLIEYKIELILLLIGGGFLGIVGVFNATLAIMRKQNLLMMGYLVVAILAFMLSSCVVARWGMLGAVVMYDLLMLMLCIIFVIILGVSIIICEKKLKNE